jgi:hypothetical protein
MIPKSVILCFKLPFEEVTSDLLNDQVLPFHKTILQELYQVTFRKNLYETIEQLQVALDECGILVHLHSIYPRAIEV